MFLFKSRKQVRIQILANYRKGNQFVTIWLTFSWGDIKPPASKTQAKHSTTEHNPAHQFRKG